LSLALEEVGRRRKFHELYARIEANGFEPTPAQFVSYEIGFARSTSEGNPFLALYSHESKQFGAGGG